MTATQASFEISTLSDPPARVGGTRLELNQLFYGPSEVLVARRPGSGTDEVSGAVRLAMRENPSRPHGFIADLVVDDDLRESGLPEQLISAAESCLKARGAEKIDAVTVDGKGWASYYFRCGFWSSRRMVVLTWDLENRNRVERTDAFRIEQVDRPDPDTTARFIINSYQPYFRWWKEPREDQKWDRVDLQPDGKQDLYVQAADDVRRRVAEVVANAGKTAPQTFFLAYEGDELVGLCDARDVPEGEESFDWCVLVTRHGGGKGLGSTLLDHALEWMKARGRRYAEYTSTSGLDDYDPLIYLSTVATGAQMRGEFLNLVKNRL
jgi:GNAT superfamily N-acetyltransferase